MRSLFASAALFGLAYAGNGNGNNGRGNGNGGSDDNTRFLQWASNNSKHYEFVSEFEKRKGNWKAADASIEEMNEKSAKSGRLNAAKFGHNKFSDFDDLEWKAMTGLVGDADPDNEGLPMGDDNDRMLVATADSIDLAAAGHVGAVKDQGRCGSCWAFSANTALEGAIAIANNTAPVHLSEQQLVDCTNRSARKIVNKNYGNYGCNGGWMDNAWDFQRD